VSVAREFWLITATQAHLVTAATLEAAARKFIGNEQNGELLCVLSGELRYLPKQRDLRLRKAAPHIKETALIKESPRFYWFFSARECFAAEGRTMPKALRSIRGAVDVTELRAGIRGDALVPRFAAQLVAQVFLK